MTGEGRNPLPDRKGLTIYVEPAGNFRWRWRVTDDAGNWNATSSQYNEYRVDLYDGRSKGPSGADGARHPAEGRTKTKLGAVRQAGKAVRRIVKLRDHMEKDGMSLSAVSFE